MKRPDFLRFLSVRRAFLQLPFARSKTPSELLELIERWGVPTHATTVVRVTVLGSHPLAVRHFAQAYHVDATVNAARGSIMVRSACGRCLTLSFHTLSAILIARSLDLYLYHSSVHVYIALSLSVLTWPPQGLSRKSRANNRSPVHTPLRGSGSGTSSMSSSTASFSSAASSPATPHMSPHVSSTTLNSPYASASPHSSSSHIAPYVAAGAGGASISASALALSRRSGADTPPASPHANVMAAQYVLPSMEVTDIASAIEQLVQLSAAWARVAVATNTPPPPHVLATSVRLELRQHNYDLHHAVYTLKQLLSVPASVGTYAADWVSVNDQAARLATVATDLSALLSPLVRHFGSALAALLTKANTLVCCLDACQLRPAQDTFAAALTQLHQLDEALTLGPILSLGSRDRWRKVVAAAADARATVARIVAQQEPVIQDICKELTDAINEVRARFDGLGSSVVNFIALPVQEMFAGLDRVCGSPSVFERRTHFPSQARALPAASRGRASMFVASVASLLVPALDLIDLMDFMTHVSQVVVKHSGVVLTETLAHSDLRPVEVIDTSGVDKNFVRLFRDHSSDHKLRSLTLARYADQKLPPASLARRGLPSRRAQHRQRRARRQVSGDRGTEGSAPTLRPGEGARRADSGEQSEGTAQVHSRARRDVRSLRWMCFRVSAYVRACMCVSVCVWRGTQ